MEKNVVSASYLRFLKGEVIMNGMHNISTKKNYPKVEEENIYIKYLSQFHHHLWTFCRTYPPFQLGSPSPISEAAEKCNDATMAPVGLHM